MSLRNKTRNIILSFLLICITYITFNSCSFLLSDDIQEQSKKNVQNNKQTLTLCVSPEFRSSGLGGRSAYPDFSTINLENGKTFSASCSGVFNESNTTGSYNSSTKKITYSISSNIFTDQEVTFYINDSSNKKLYFAKSTVSYNTIGTSLDEISLCFAPYIDSNASNNINGFINLSVSTSSGYRLVCSIEGNPSAITIDSPNQTISVKTGTDGIAPGSYKATISIYADSDFDASGVLKTGIFPRDSVIQTICVWPGLTTNKWYLSNGMTAGDYSITISSNIVRLYVKGTNCQGIYKTGNELASVEASPTNSGSIANPVSTLQAAIDKCSSSSTEYKIIVDGTVTGTSTIGGDIDGDGIPFDASSLTITGSTSEAEIRGYASIPVAVSNSTLTVNASSADFTVTITDLNITGGHGSYGGGIDIQKGTVTLTNGTKIYGNKASNGGGVAVRSADAKLYMIGSSLIGYDTTTDSYPTVSALGTTEGKAANYSGYGGGLYIGNSGTVYLGCDSSGNVTDEYKLNDGYGIRQNNASQSGGGIYSTSGILYMAGGTIAYNSSYSGGGLHNAGIFNFSSGVVKGNNATTGGAVYQTSTFNISGTASVPYGVGSEFGEGKNDVYVYKNRYITVAAAFDTSAPEIVAYIRPYSWTRGTSVITKATSLSSLTADMIAKFKTIDSDFTISKSSNNGILSAPIYVAGTGAVHCKGTPSSLAAARGTAEQPFASISVALNAITTSATTITVDGILIGSQTIEIFPSAASSVTAITLTGYKASGASSSSAKIDGNNSGSALTINTDKKITISDLTITNGNANGETDDAKNGGGINIINTSACVALSTGTVITANSATKFGGGVYVKDGAVLDMSAGEISGNTASVSGGGIYGGDGSSIYLHGTALIGSATESVATSQTDCSNKALGTALYTGGGGIYTSGNLYLGYKPENSNPVADSLSGGVNRNLAKEGGGIYVYSSSGSPSVKLASGSISYNRADYNSIGNGGGIKFDTGSLTIEGTLLITHNYAYNDGGGLESAENSEVTMTGGEVSHNEARSTGGGLSVCGYSFDMSGGLITRNSAENSAGIEDQCDNFSLSGTAEISFNTATSCGGGIKIVMDGECFNMTGGTIKNNTAHCGGGIYVSMEAELDISGGNIEQNVADTGAGIYDGGIKLTISGTAFLYGNNADTSGGCGGAIYTEGTLIISGGSLDSNEAESGGAVYSNYGNVTVSAGIINQNSATDGSGGAISIIGGNLVISGGEFTYNGAKDDGGAIYFDGDSNTLNITEYTEFHNNSAGNHGGGLYIEDCQHAEINGCEFANNEAELGGGIYCQNSDLTLLQSDGEDLILAGNINTAADTSKDIHMESGNLLLGGSITFNADGSILLVGGTKILLLSSLNNHGEGIPLYLDDDFGWEAGLQVIDLADDSSLSSVSGEIGIFHLVNNTSNFVIDSDGYLQDGW